MGFKYSVFTVMTPDLSLEEVAAALKSMGYDGVEWRVTVLPKKIEKIDFWRGNKATVDASRLIEEAPRVRRLSHENGLAILALGTYLSAENRAEIEDAMKAARIMGCSQIRVQVPRYDGSKHYNDLLQETVKRFSDVEKLAKKYEVKANIEIHHRTICPSASSAYRIVSNFDPDHIGVIYDPGNMICEGYESWQMGLQILGPYLAHVHVKNAKWESSTEKSKSGRWLPVWCGLSEGLVDWSEVLSALQKVGYDGWLSFEDFSEGDSLTKLKKNLEYMKDLERRLR
ncbi:MAG: sugar phosphate isomerase/epimerase family protein [Candidatus Bathyarchaeia archaeon]